jgi:hypothetical protein
MHRLTRVDTCELSEMFASKRVNSDVLDSILRLHSRSDRTTLEGLTQFLALGLLRPTFAGEGSTAVLFLAGYRSTSASIFCSASCARYPPLTIVGERPGPCHGHLDECEDNGVEYELYVSARRVWLEYNPF